MNLISIGLTHPFLTVTIENRCLSRAEYDRLLAYIDTVVLPWLSFEVIDDAPDADDQIDQMAADAIEEHRRGETRPFPPHDKGGE